MHILIDIIMYKIHCICIPILTGIAYHLIEGDADQDLFMASHNDDKTACNPVGNSKDLAQLIRIAGCLHVLCSILQSTIQQKQVHLQLEVDLKCMKAAHQLFMVLMRQKTLFIDVRIYLHSS